MDYTLAIYNQQEMDELSIRATIEKLVARGYPEFVAHDSLLDTTFPVRGLLIDKRFGHILKMNRYKFVTKGYHGFRELAKEELRALYHSEEDPPRHPALPLDRHPLRPVRGGPLRRARRGHGEAGPGHRLRQGLHRHPREHRRGAPRRDHPRGGRRRLPALRQQGPRARADAPQAAERGQEALPPHQLALVVHRQDDDVPARRRDGRVPALAQLLRRRHRRRDQAGVLPGAAPAHGARRREARTPPSFPLERGQDLRGRQPAATSSARSARRATRCSTWATTSTATSSAARRRAPGARR